MAVELRSFLPDDYSSLAAVYSAATPDYPRTAAELRFEDDHRDPRCRAQRWLAESDGEIVGCAGYDQSAILYHPQKFVLDGAVLPARQGLGVGAALYEHLCHAVSALTPLSFRVEGVREGRVRTIRLLEDRGFREVFRAWDLRLDLNTFREPAPTEGESRLRPRGLDIYSLKQLQADPLRDRKLYDLVCEVQADEPTPEPVRLPDYEHFVTNMLTSPDLARDAFFVAVSSASDYAGLSFLWLGPDNTVARCGLTGVARKFRRQGLARALKLHTIEHAWAHGYSTMSTSNAARNEAMLALNGQLGFEKQGMSIDFLKQFGPGAS